MANVFPQFWTTLQTELGEHVDDLIQVKSVLTILGYTLKSSVASLKTPKKVNDLESEYTKMRSTNQKSMCDRFPDLASIDTFTPGMKSIIIEIAAHLNRSSKPSAESGSLIEITRSKLLSQAKKICDKFNETHLSIEETASGVECKTSCPECQHEDILSFSTSSKGKSFSIYNFRRHFSKHQSNGHEESADGECSTTESDRNDCDERLKILTEKNKEIEKQLKQQLAEKSILQGKYDEVVAEKMDLDSRAENRTEFGPIIGDGCESSTAAESIQKDCDELKEKLKSLTTKNEEIEKQLKQQLAEKSILQGKYDEVVAEKMDLESKQKNYTNEHERIVASKDVLIAKVHEKMAELRKNHVALQTELELMKKMRNKIANKDELSVDLETGLENKTTMPPPVKIIEQLNYELSLCCFEKITAPGINISKKYVKFEDCTGRNVILNFDHIYHGYDDKFNDVKPAIDSFIAGGISSIITYGTTGSGKTSTMFGADDTTFGLLGQSGERILKSKPFTVSAFEIHENVCLDLLNNKESLIEKEFEPKKNAICSVDEFTPIVKQIIDSRTHKPTDQNLNSSRSHLFVILEIESSSSKMAFVDLAGFEVGKQTEESKHINSSLSELNRLLINATKNQKMIPQKSNKMTMHLLPFLSPKCKTIILCHINNAAPKKGLEYLKDFASSTTELKRRNTTPLSDITNSKIIR